MQISPEAYFLKMKIIFLGKPGAGKGTQAKMLANELKIPHISTGDMFRRALAEKTKLGLEAYQYWGNGNLVPDEIMNKIVKKRISEPDCKNGYILDGYPRKIEQAQYLDNISSINHVISLEVSNDTVIKRMLGRLTCPDCGRAYNKNTEPKPKKDNLCDDCGIELKVRSDETEDGIRTRLQIYDANIREIKEFYKTKNLLREVDAEKDIKGILKQINQIIP